jgi:hypothetical protein
MAKNSLDDSALAGNLSCTRTIASDHLAEGAALTQAASDDAIVSCRHPSLTHDLWAGQLALSTLQRILSWKESPLERGRHAR